MDHTLREAVRRPLSRRWMHSQTREAVSCAVPNETGSGDDAALLHLDDINPQQRRASVSASGGVRPMSTILSLLTLFYREYFRTKLGEMKALPHLPVSK
jgi:hypothetical protein